MGAARVLGIATVCFAAALLGPKREALPEHMLGHECVHTDNLLTPAAT